MPCIHPSFADLPPKLLIGVSGGADSVYLLHRLIESDRHKLVVCHLHHGLRDQEADLDRKFVQDLCATYDIPFDTKQINLKARLQAQQKEGFETIARDERLLFFAECADKHNIRDIVLAHHADDQAETILMNLCRGSAGIKGIQPWHHLQQYNLNLWRPLLPLRKEELLSWLSLNQKKWREDATNQESTTTRNTIRNKVIPILNIIFHRPVTPNINRSMEANLNNNLGEIFESLNILDPQGRIYLPKFQTFSPSLQAHLLYHYLTQHQIPNLAAAKIKECLQLVLEKNIWKINLSKGTCLRRKEKRLFLEKNS